MNPDKAPMRISNTQQEAVRAVSSKYRQLNDYAASLEILEAPDIEFFNIDPNFERLDTLGYKRLVYEMIRSRYESLEKPVNGSMIQYLPMEPNDIYDTIRAVKNNRKSLAEFDAMFEQIMMYGTSIQDYDKARDMCSMTLSEYIAIETEECRTLRPDCKIGFRVSFYVSSGCEIKVFKFTEDEVLEIAAAVAGEMAALDKHNVMMYKIRHEDDGII